MMKSGSNWNKLKKRVSTAVSVTGNEIKKEAKIKQSGKPLSAKEKERYVGLDCEMVGIGPDGKQSALARCCFVDFDGNTLYDEYVRPPGYVTDFRTKWSGIRKKDLRHGTAITLQECQKAVALHLKEKILVGHALRNDLDVLMLSHPRTMIRDTAMYRPYMRIHGKHGKLRPRSLKDLSAQHLGLDIQGGEHDPAEDARCAMFLYTRCRQEWEQQLRDRQPERKLKNKATKHVQQRGDQEQHNEVRIIALDELPAAAASTDLSANTIAATCTRRITISKPPSNNLRREDGTYLNGGLPASSACSSIDIEVAIYDDSSSSSSTVTTGMNTGMRKYEDVDEQQRIEPKPKRKRTISRSGNISSNSKKHYKNYDAISNQRKAISAVPNTTSSTTTTTTTTTTAFADVPTNTTRSGAQVEIVQSIGTTKPHNPISAKKKIRSIADVDAEMSMHKRKKKKVT